MGRAIKGQVSTPENPCGSKIMLWIRDVALTHQGGACLTWPFGTMRDGYAGMGREGKALRAHRYICQHVRGEPPTPEHHAAHSCGKGHEACVSPHHLSWKTPSENFKEGAKHPRHKLTPEEVAEIRRTADIEKSWITAARFKVTDGTIRKIRAGKLWKTGRREIGGFTSESAKRANLIVQANRAARCSI